MENLKFIRPKDCDLGDNVEDYLIQISNIKKGETIYECNYGRNVQLKALEDAKKTEEGWVCCVETLSGEIGELFLSASTEYVGIKLFKTPQYLEYDEKKGYIYPII